MPGTKQSANNVHEMNEMIHNNVRMKPYGHDTQTKSLFFFPWMTGKILSQSHVSHHDFIYNFYLIYQPDRKKKILTYKNKVLPWPLQLCSSFWVSISVHGSDILIQLSKPEPQSCP